MSFSKKKTAFVLVLLATIGMMIAGVVLTYREFDDLVSGGTNGTRSLNGTTVRCLEYSRSVSKQWMSTIVTLLTIKILLIVITICAILAVCSGVVTCICGPPKERSCGATLLLYFLFLMSAIFIIVLLMKSNPDCLRLKTGLVLILMSLGLGIFGWYIARPTVFATTQSVKKDNLLDDGANP